MDLGRFLDVVDLTAFAASRPSATCDVVPPVFDLPAAQPLAREIIASSTVADRITLEPGDFFTDPLPAGDLYALGRILHDWSEEKIRLLLRRVHDALPGGGAVLIAEKLVHDDRTGPVGALMQDLNMLTCTEGKERTLGEYASLAPGGRFRRCSGRPDAVAARCRHGGQALRVVAS